VYTCIGDWISSGPLSTAGAPVLHLTIHFFKKNIKIVMKIKDGAEI
jgi:hypothetical protein